MVVLRCTRKLLDRVGPPADATATSTNALGDWYANLVPIGHQRILLLVSERSRLPVLMHGRDVKNLALKFPDVLEALLRALDMPALPVVREVEATRDSVIAATNSRSLLGSLNDFAQLLKWHAPSVPQDNLMAQNIRLCNTPLAPLDYHFPFEIAQELLERTW